MTRQEREQEIVSDLVRMRSGPPLSAEDKKRFVALLLELKALREHNVAAIRAGEVS